MIGRLEEEKYAIDPTYAYTEEVVNYDDITTIVNQLAEEYNGGWIPCEKEMPPQPQDNPLFENKPLELYLATEKGSDYPWRVFWNGKYFTDGWSKVNVIAWRPLPEPYKPKGE